MDYKVTCCEVCEKELHKPTGLRGGPRKRCQEHASYKKKLCDNCNSVAWKSHSRSKKCIACSAEERLSVQYRSCKETECDQKHHAKGYCRAHYVEHCVTQKQDYSKVVRSIRTLQCLGCGQAFECSTRSTRKYCSHACAMKNRPKWKIGAPAPSREQSERKKLKARSCEWCGQVFESTNRRRFCTKDCQYIWQRDSEQANRNGRVLNMAIEDHDYDTILSEVSKRVRRMSTGCWEWPVQDKNGYAKHIGMPLHRIVLEAKHRAPLGSQAAHHKCANSGCVNPDHLQPVTHAENSAEMLQRAAMTQRISELEQVVAELSPNHPVLNRIQLFLAS